MAESDDALGMLSPHIFPEELRGVIASMQNAMRELASRVNQLETAQVVGEPATEQRTMLVAVQQDEDGRTRFFQQKVTMPVGAILDNPTPELAVEIQASQTGSGGGGGTTTVIEGGPIYNIVDNSP